MQFDILPLTDAEVSALSTIQLKLLRTAQKQKNELKHDKERKLEEYARLLFGNEMQFSSLLIDKTTQLNAEYEREVAILREQLQFNMSLNEPTTPDDTGGSDKGDGEEEAGYIVDYTLSYLDRYIIVRDYYMAIADAEERLALYAADDTAKNYLNSYYATLYNYLAQFV